MSNKLLYGMRQEEDASWAVIDLKTGRPAFVEGAWQVGLDVETADDVVDFLNGFARTLCCSGERDGFHVLGWAWRYSA